MTARHAVFVDRVADLFMHGQADAFVEVALAAKQFDVLDNLGLGRQLFNHFLFTATQ